MHPKGAAFASLFPPFIRHAKTDPLRNAKTLRNSQVFRPSPTQIYPLNSTKTLKIIVDRDNKQILGASFLGVEADEVIHCVLDTMYAKAPYTVIQRAMHIHPTVSEFIPTMMDNLKPLQ